MSTSDFPSRERKFGRATVEVILTLAITSTTQQQQQQQQQQGNESVSDREIRLRMAFEDLNQIDRQINELRISPPGAMNNQASCFPLHPQQSSQLLSQQQAANHPQLRGRVTYQNQSSEQLQTYQHHPSRIAVQCMQHQYTPPRTSLVRSVSDGFQQHPLPPQQSFMTIAPTLPPQPRAQQFAQPLTALCPSTAQRLVVFRLQQIPGTTDQTPMVYMVHFKRRVSEYLSVPSKAHHVFCVSDFVVVSSEPFGEDLGVVVEVLTAEEYDVQRRAGLAPVDRRQAKMALQWATAPGVSASEITGRILRLANISERQRLPFKHTDEEAAVAYCQHLIRDVIRMPQMAVFDAEFTIDRRKLTFYYHSEVHVDFRELVKDMYTKYKTRIWMKKMSQEPVFRPHEFALVQLITGAQLTPQNHI
eukprot:gene29104-36094_t